MLILTRRVGESLMIGDEISLRVLNVNGQHVRLGIVAPKDIEIYREEIYLRIQQQKGQGAGLPNAAGFIESGEEASQSDGQDEKGDDEHDCHTS